METWKKKKDQIDEVDYVDRYENSDKVITELETLIVNIRSVSKRRPPTIYGFTAMELHLFLTSKIRWIIRWIIFKGYIFIALRPMRKPTRCFSLLLSGIPLEIK